jgi:hypothetical protein
MMPASSRISRPSITWSAGDVVLGVARVPEVVGVDHEARQPALHAAHLVHRVVVQRVLIAPLLILHEPLEHVVGEALIIGHCSSVVAPQHVELIRHPLPLVLRELLGHVVEVVVVEAQAHRLEQPHRRQHHRVA